MAEELRKRQTAYKVSIGLLLTALEKGLNLENERFKFLSFQGRDIYRINLIANVIDKFESNQKPYVSITLDDGTGNIRVKAFADNIGMLQNLQLGDSVLVIGILRYYNDELYILPEIVKVLEPKWLVARKLELEKEYGKIIERQEPEELNLNQNINKNDLILDETSSIRTNIKAIETPQDQNFDIEIEKIQSSQYQNFKEEIKTVREKVLDLIRDAETEGGIDIDKIIMSLKDPVDQINKEITTLLEDGTIYEPKPGRLRIL